ncbi:MAG: Na+/H+ antiporter subunit C [Anaerolineae bacterium]|nr:Na+/H+ antiporter subunit C [Anaerolineae bacterium]
MNVLLALVVGVLFAGGLYMMMRRSLVKVLVGMLLLSNAVNLTIFTVGRLVPARPPLIGLEARQVLPGSADPLPQALILTAIVISFGMTAFAVTLIRKTYQKIGTDDLDSLRCTDLPCPDEPDWRDPGEEAH